MPNAESELFMLPPPRIVRFSESLPHLGGLRLAPYVGELPDEIEPIEPSPLEDGFDDERAGSVLERTLTNDTVRQRLAATRWAAIGVSRFGEPAKGEPRWYMVVAYDYLKNVAVEITVDGEGDVRNVVDADYQPPASDAELARAVELARADQRLADVDFGGLDPATIQLQRAQIGGADVEGRLVEVLFGCRHERLPRYRAWVDLSIDRVLHAGPADTCCGCNKEEAHS